MIEIFGYIGCIFVIISMLMTSVVKLRVINIYNLIKLSKADGNHYDMIRGNKEDSYLTYFIKHYKKDMKKYFLENTLELSAADTIYTVCCEGVPAGVLAGKKEGDALEISFDYTTPTYRCRTDFADIQNKKECGGNRQWQNHYLRNWAANTKGKGII